MTTPLERMRSIRWGREVLEQIAIDPLVPGPMQVRAAVLSSKYPTTDLIEGHIANSGHGLPLDWAVILGQALTLFGEIGGDGFGSDDTRLRIRYVQRHYPEPNLLAFFSQGYSLQGWLKPED